MAYLRILGCAALWLAVACSRDHSGDGVDEDDGAGDGDGDGDVDLPDDNDFESGSRLRLRFLTTADGLAAFETYFDTELDSACKPLPASDDKVRCLPGELTSGLFYLDDDCTQPAIYDAEGVCGDEAAAYYYAHVAGTCPARYEVFRRGAELTLPDQLFEANTGACQGFKVPPGKVAPLTRLEPGDLVELAPELGPSSGKLAARYVTSPDGSRVLSGYTDTSLDFDCAFQDLGDGPRCTGAFDGFIDTDSFGDASCSSPVVTLYGCAEAPFAYDRGFDAETCRNDVKAFELGEQLDMTYWMSESCVAFKSPAPDGSYARGPEVARTTFEQVQTGQRGGSRIVSNTFRHPGLPDFPGGGLHDLELDIDCQVERGMDGKERCLPASSGYSYYSDEACRDLVVALPLPACADPPAFVTTQAASFSGCEADGVRVVSLGASVANPGTVFEKHGESCTMTLPVGSSWYAVSGERPLTDFAEISHQLD